MIADTLLLHNFVLAAQHYREAKQDSQMHQKLILLPRPPHCEEISGAKRKTHGRGLWKPKKGPTASISKMMNSRLKSLNKTGIGD